MMKWCRWSDAGHSLKVFIPMIVVREYLVVENQVTSVLQIQIIDTMKKRNIFFWELLKNLKLHLKRPIVRTVQNCNYTLGGAGSQNFYLNTICQKRFQNSISIFFNFRHFLHDIWWNMFWTRKPQIRTAVQKLFARQQKPWKQIYDYFLFTYFSKSLQIS